MNALLLPPLASLDQLLSGIQPEQRVAIVIVTIGCLTGILITTICVVSGMVRNAAEVRLKRELIDRGMSAEEIATVVEATPPTDFLERKAMKER